MNGFRCGRRAASTSALCYSRDVCRDWPSWRRDGAWPCLLLRKESWRFLGKFISLPPSDPGKKVFALSGERQFGADSRQNLPPLASPILPVVEFSEVSRALALAQSAQSPPYNRQAFASFGPRKCLPTRSGKSLCEKYFRPLKALRFGGRYRHCPLTRNGVPRTRHARERPADRWTFRVKEWLDGTDAIHLANRGNETLAHDDSPVDAPD